MAMACSTERRRLTYSSTTPTTTKWADELPPELLGLIVKKLASNVVDIIRFEAVCSSWNHATRLYTSAPQRLRLPLRPGKGSTAKVVLSSDPSCNNNFVVVVIYDISLGPPGIAFYQHGRGGNAAAWTDLEGSHDHYSDIVFHNNGQLFALSTNHSIQVWDFGDTYNNYPTKIMDFQPSMNPNVLDGPMTHHKKWLVESMGEILFVERQWLWLGSDTKGTVDFYVCKLNIAAQKWEKVECLLCCALFLVRNQSAMSLSTRELPKLEENSIYYAETYQEGDLYKRKLHRGWSEIRVGGVFKFNLETKVVKPYYISREHVDTSYSKPVWIVPSPQ
ncbi:PREDICTED: F-box [Prunus dulcis]|uniref:PREDICTED: F-box n=1 Tax=Prunus dulcis TaxID=3755 RepID=A0A5E4EW96_PRUDU|nr:PREDICTED: F-box [Prunus dulcis]